MGTIITNTELMKAISEYLNHYYPDHTGEIIDAYEGRYYYGDPTDIGDDGIFIVFDDKDNGSYNQFINVKVHELINGSWMEQE